MLSGRASRLFTGRRSVASPRGGLAAHPADAIGAASGIQASGIQASGAVSHDRGLIFALCLDGTGGAVPIDWPGVRQWRPESGQVWIDLLADDETAKQWLTEESGIDDLAAEALLEPETRPRATRIGDGFLVQLRGVNLNPGAEPDDMVSVRLWVEAERIVSVRFRKLFALEDVRATLLAGNGPEGAPAILVTLADKLVDRMAPVIDSLEDAIDDIEDESVEEASQRLNKRLAVPHKRTIQLRRFVAPQREAMAVLAQSDIAWLDDHHRHELRESGNQIQRLVEALEALRDRSNVVLASIQSTTADKLNRNLYLLSVVAAAFLPATLVTGAFGMNVGGLPWIEEPWGFAGICIALTVLVVLELWLLRKIRLI